MIRRYHCNNFPGFLKEWTKGTIYSVMVRIVFFQIQFNVFWIIDFVVDHQFYIVIIDISDISSQSDNISNDTRLESFNHTFPHLKVLIIMQTGNGTVILSHKICYFFTSLYRVADYKSLLVAQDCVQIEKIKQLCSWILHYNIVLPNIFKQHRVISYAKNCRFENHLFVDGGVLLVVNITRAGAYLSVNRHRFQNSLDLFNHMLSFEKVRFFKKY